jgi:hypothetical protein
MSEYLANALIALTVEPTTPHEESAQLLLDRNSRFYELIRAFVESYGDLGTDLQPFGSQGRRPSPIDLFGEKGERIDLEPALTDAWNAIERAFQTMTDSSLSEKGAVRLYLHALHRACASSAARE